MKLRKYTIFYKGFNKKILALAKLKMQSTVSGAFLIAKKINCVIIKKKIIFDFKENLWTFAVFRYG